MARRIVDAIVLWLVAVYGWHILDGAVRLYLSLRGTRGPISDRLVDRVIAAYVAYDRTG